MHRGSGRSPIQRGTRPSSPHPPLPGGQPEEAHVMRGDTCRGDPQREPIIREQGEPIAREVHPVRASAHSLYYPPPYLYSTIVHKPTLSVPPHPHSYPLPNSSSFCHLPSIPKCNQTYLLQYLPNILLNSTL